MKFHNEFWFKTIQWIKHLCDEIFLCGKTKENNDMAFSAYQNLYNEWLTFGKLLLLLSPTKTLYLYLRTWNTIPSFLHLFTNKTIYWFVFNLWSFQQTAQNKPLHYPLKSKLLPYWYNFSIIHASIYLICYDIQKWSYHSMNNTQQHNKREYLLMALFWFTKSTKGKLHLGRWWKTVIKDDLDFVADEVTSYLS